MKYNNQQVYKEIAKQRAVSNARFSKELQLLQEYAKTKNIRVVHIYDRVYPKGGLTIAFRKSNPYSSGYMVDVAVAVCSPKDSFSRKLGCYYAISKFSNNEIIRLPILCHYLERDINEVVKSVFTAFYRSLGNNHNWLVPLPRSQSNKG